MRAKLIKNAKLVVVKLGTGVLTDRHNRLACARIKQILVQVAKIRKGGREVVLVSSGAVGAGMEALGYDKRPTRLEELQACAAVGQSKLMAIYNELFAAHNIQVAQVLLTHDDLQDRDRHLNARNTLMALLAQGVVPVINENDAVSFTELTVGDNDLLSALVTALLPADLLVLLTTADGLIRNFGKSNAKLISTVKNIDSTTFKIARGTDSETSVGGMVSKLKAAKIVMRAGIPMLIGNGMQRGVLGKILSADLLGTFFLPSESKLKGRKRWIAFFHHPQGVLIVDDGAKAALRDHGMSLLLPGIIKCEGKFEIGDVVKIRDHQGTDFAQGVTKVSWKEIDDNPGKVVVHRDDLVVL
ncbi:MAG: glutamate 5-kinase [Verrucomicrobiales bacterium]|nr:glutamate 5-kinase [Verrucomicrobiales bacterium]